LNDTKKEWVAFGVVLITVIIGCTIFFVRAEENQGISSEIVSQTEYVPGDEGQVIGEVRYVLTGATVPATCYASVYYPNKTIVFYEQTMTNNAFGTHFLNFTIPSIEGVYEYQTKCDVGAALNITRSKAFHVSSGFREIKEEINATRRINAYVVK